MAKSYRIERVNETIKEIIGDLLLNGIKDPRVGFVTITGVRTSGDLSVARVHYSVLGDEEVRSTAHKGLVSAARFIQRVLAKELKVRISPHLVFIYDDSLDRAMRIEEMLREAEAGSQEPKADVDGDKATE